MSILTRIWPGTTASRPSRSCSSSRAAAWRPATRASPPRPPCARPWRGRAGPPAKPQAVPKWAGSRQRQDGGRVVSLLSVDVPGPLRLVEAGQQLDGVGPVADGAIDHAQPLERPVLRRARVAVTLEPNGREG